ncbi:hypothetical protein TKK_0015102 [Trichogramma kaykai]
MYSLGHMNSMQVVTIGLNLVGKYYNNRFRNIRPMDVEAVAELEQGFNQELSMNFGVDPDFNFRLGEALQLNERFHFHRNLLRDGDNILQIPQQLQNQPAVQANIYRIRNNGINRRRRRRRNPRQQRQRRRADDAALVDANEMQQPPPQNVVAQGTEPVNDRAAAAAAAVNLLMMLRPSPPPLPRNVVTAEPQRVAAVDDANVLPMPRPPSPQENVVAPEPPRVAAADPENVLTFFKTDTKKGLYCFNNFNNNSQKTWFYEILSTLTRKKKLRSV